MTTCIVCCEGGDSGGKSLNDISGSDQTLRMRLEKVLDECVLGAAWMCFSCESDLIQIETLQNQFKQRYLDTAKLKQQWECKVHDSSLMFNTTKLHSDGLLNLANASLSTPGGMHSKINSQTIPLKQRDTEELSIKGIHTVAPKVIRSEDELDQVLEGQDLDVEETGVEDHEQTDVDESEPHAKEYNPKQKTLRKHSSNAKRGFYECPLCNKFFRLAYGLEMHHILVHKEKRAKPSGNNGKRTSAPTTKVKKHDRKAAARSLTERRHCAHSMPDDLMTDSLKNKLVDIEPVEQKTIHFQCTLCGNVFRGAWGLQMHMKRHAKQTDQFHPKGGDANDTTHGAFEDLNCTECNRSFTCSRGLISHTRWHTQQSLEAEGKVAEENRKACFCSVCDLTFDDQRNLNAHFEVHRAANDNSDFEPKSNPDSLTKKHDDDDEASEKNVEPFACDLCGVVFDEKAKLVAHIAKHTVKDKVKSKTKDKDSECKADLKDNESNYETEPFSVMRKKKKKTDSPKEVEFACTNCDKSFGNKASLHRHVANEHTGKWPIACSICYKGFLAPSELKMHMSKHSVERPHVCKQCGKSFKSVTHFNHHMRFHTGKALECVVCKKQFLYNSTLEEHMGSHLVHPVTPRPKNIDKANKKHPCWICGKFISVSRLKGHMLTHTGQRNYPCSVCSKAFYTKEVLGAHMRIHSSEKPFMCDQCGKGFKSRTELRIHQATHSTERTVPCTVCEKAFRTKSDLRKHMNVHQDIRPYSCTLCECTFKQSKTLKSHMFTHSIENQFCCTICQVKFRHKYTLTLHMRKHARNPCSIPRTRVLNKKASNPSFRDEKAQQEAALP